MRRFHEQRVGKEVIVAYLKLLPRYSTGWT